MMTILMASSLLAFGRFTCCQPINETTFSHISHVSSVDESIHAGSLNMVVSIYNPQCFREVILHCQHRVSSMWDCRSAIAQFWWAALCLQQHYAGKTHQLEQMVCYVTVDLVQWPICYAVLETNVLNSSSSTACCFSCFVNVTCVLVCLLLINNR